MQQNQISTSAMDNTESAPYQPPLRPRASDYFDDGSVLAEEKDSINYDISHRRSLMTISDFRRLQQNQISTSDFFRRGYTCLLFNAISFVEETRIIHRLFKWFSEWNRCYPHPRPCARGESNLRHSPPTFAFYQTGV